LTATVLLPGTGTTYGIDAAIRETGVKIDTGNCPIEYQKSIKNEVEIEWMRKYYLDDSVAISEALMIAEQKVLNSETYSEMDVADQLIKSRTDISGAEYRYGIYIILTPFFNWVRTSVRLCVSGSKNILGKIGLLCFFCKFLKIIIFKSVLNF